MYNSLCLILTCLPRCSAGGEDHIMGDVGSGELLEEIISGSLQVLDDVVGLGELVGR